MECRFKESVKKKDQNYVYKKTIDGYYQLVIAHRLE